jgi:hypothetical protein
MAKHHFFVEKRAGQYDGPFFAFGDSLSERKFWSKSSFLTLLPRLSVRIMRNGMDQAIRMVLLVIQFPLEPAYYPRSTVWTRLHLTKDIPALVRHFTKKYAKKMDRKIDKIPAETVKALVSWSWPGNVRELENFIERSVILSRGPSLPAPLAELRGDSREGAGAPPRWKKWNGITFCASYGRPEAWSAPRPIVWACRGRP